ncbi:MAG: TetR/AcrR family transcriptional regulator [Gammaproteobacteria bacterium]|nr:TetR/AcrR family transcriptional regulator [Gammaproteobacteria bacterium]
MAVMKSRAPALQSSFHQGTRQAANILRAARQVFARDGAASFSTRRVAREAKLGLASVQHVFPTTESLLIAMVESIVNSYHDAYRDRIAELPLNARTRLAGILDYLLEDVCNEKTRRVFFGLWDYGCHRGLVARLLDQGYARQRDSLAGFIAAVRSDLSDDDCRMLAATIIVMIDGSMIFTAADSRVIPQREFLAHLRQVMLNLIDRALPGCGVAIDPPLTQRRRRI